MILTRKIFRYNGKLYRINKNKNHRMCLDCALRKPKPGLGCMFNCISVKTNIRRVIIVSYDNN